MVQNRNGTLSSFSPTFPQIDHCDVRKMPTFTGRDPTFLDQFSFRLSPSEYHKHSRKLTQHNHSDPASIHSLVLSWPSGGLSALGDSWLEFLAPEPQIASVYISCSQDSTRTVWRLSGTQPAKIPGDCSELKKRKDVFVRLPNKQISSFRFFVFSIFFHQVPFGRNHCAEPGWEWGDQIRLLRRSIWFPTVLTIWCPKRYSNTIQNAN
jgi:hypothetical protein